jgi:hypothetical protein
VPPDNIWLEGTLAHQAVIYELWASGKPLRDPVPREDTIRRIPMPSTEAQVVLSIEESPEVGVVSYDERSTVPLDQWGNDAGVLVTVRNFVGPVPPRRTSPRYPRVPVGKMFFVFFFILRSRVFNTSGLFITHFEEHLMLTEAVRTLVDTVPDSKPDGLDVRVHPNLFALLGAARRERAMAEYVRMSDGWDQAALLAELEALLTTDEWYPPNMTPELARHVGDLLRSGVRVAKLRLVPPSHSPDDPTVTVAPEEVHILRLWEAIYEMYVPKDGADGV